MRQYSMRKTRPRRRLFSSVFPVVFVLIGIALLAQPVASDWWAAKQASDSISEITSVYSDMDNPDRILNEEQAVAWNASLKGELDESYELWDYDTQLTYKGTPSTMMAYIDIPKIATKLPVYHYTTEDVLSAGVGHIEWSALPVGGEGTRCLLSGHSGMQNTRMFDDIRRLEIGDTFVIWTLSKPYCYRVCEIETIEPADVDKCLPEEGRDLCSLITCTPFGVNTHRLVVTGERCDYVVEDIGVTAPVSAYVNRRTIPLLAGCSALLVVLVVIIIGIFARRYKKVATEKLRVQSKQRRKRSVLMTVVPYMFMLGGLIGLGYPVAVDFWESYQAECSISQVTSTYNSMNEPQRTDVEHEAELYNLALSGRGNLLDRLPYSEQLAFDGSEMIAYLSIPKLSVKLPVFHGTDENTLMIGVGHLEGTKLPLGGFGRSVLAGHSGMPNARMFDDIHLLEEGDQFVLWVLGKAYAYEVVETDVVLPTEVESLYADGDRDLVTLVTCTPYGVNSHRLLVTGERCEYVEDMEVVPDVEVYVNRRTMPLLIGIGFIVLLLIVSVCVRLRRRRARNTEAIAL